MSGKHLIWAASILSLGAIIAVAISIYFSPFHTCVRGEIARGSSAAEIACASAVGGVSRSYR